MATLLQPKYAICFFSILLFIWPLSNIEQLAQYRQLHQLICAESQRQHDENVLYFAIYFHVPTGIAKRSRI